MGMDTKLQFVSNEALRRHLRCSDQACVHAHLEVFRDRLWKGGVPGSHNFRAIRQCPQAICRYYQAGTNGGEASVQI